MEQVGWLHAIPEKQEGDALTRLEQMKAKGEVPLLPPNPAPYLTDWLFEIGPSSGDGAISFGDLAAWQGIVGVDLKPWEAKLIRRLSGVYLGTLRGTRKPDCPPPYTGLPDDIIANRAAVDAKVRAAFLNLKKKI